MGKKPELDDRGDPVSCDNCDWTGYERDTTYINDYNERVDPGGVAPAGQCPKCGCLAYLLPEDEMAEWRQQVYDKRTRLGFEDWLKEQEAHRRDPADDNQMEEKDVNSETAVKQSKACPSELEIPPEVQSIAYLFQYQPQNSWYCSYIHRPFTNGNKFMLVNGRYRQLSMWNRKLQQAEVKYVEECQHLDELPDKIHGLLYWAPDDPSIPKFTRLAKDSQTGVSWQTALATAQATRLSLQQLLREILEAYDGDCLSLALQEGLRERIMEALPADACPTPPPIDLVSQLREELQQANELLPSGKPETTAQEPTSADELRMGYSIYCAACREAVPAPFKVSENCALCELKQVQAENQRLQEELRQAQTERKRAEEQVSIQQLVNKEWCESDERLLACLRTTEGFNGVHRTTVDEAIWLIRHWSKLKKNWTRSQEDLLQEMTKLTEQKQRLIDGNAKLLTKLAAKEEGEQLLSSRLLEAGKRSDAYPTVMHQAAAVLHWYEENIKTTSTQRQQWQQLLRQMTQEQQQARELRGDIQTRLEASLELLRKMRFDSLLQGDVNV